MRSNVSISSTFSYFHSLLYRPPNTTTKFPTISGSERLFCMNVRHITIYIPLRWLLTSSILPILLFQTVLSCPRLPPRCLYRTHLPPSVLLFSLTMCSNQYLLLCHIFLSSYSSVFLRTTSCVILCLFAFFSLCYIRTLPSF